MKFKVSTFLMLFAGFISFQACASELKEENDEALLRFANPKSKDDAVLYKKLTNKDDYQFSTTDGRALVFTHNGTVVWRLGVMPINTKSALSKDTWAALEEVAQKAGMLVVPKSDESKENGSSGSSTSDETTEALLKKTNFGLASIWPFFPENYKFDDKTASQTAKALKAIMASYATNESIQTLPKDQHCGVEATRTAVACLQYVKMSRDNAKWMSAVYKAAGFKMVTEGADKNGLVPFMSGKPDCQLWYYLFP